MKKIILSLLLCVLSVASRADESAKNAVYFVEPSDGATVTSPFKVKFGLSGMELRPAGDMTANTGHFHVLINAEPVAEGTVIPADATHLHFGKAQTETELKLDPGTYRLTLELGNGAHVAYGPAMSKTITVTVK